MGRGPRLPGVMKQPKWAHVDRRLTSPRPGRNVRRGFALHARQRGGHDRRRRGRCAAQCTAGLLCAPRACALTQPLAFGVRSGGAQHFAKNQSGQRRACSHIFLLGKGCFLQAEGSRTVCGCPQSGYKRDKALARSRVMRLWRNVRYKARRFCGNPMDGSGIAACFPSASLTKAPSANQCPPHNAQPASHAVHLLPHSRFCAMK